MSVSKSQELEHLRTFKLTSRLSDGKGSGAWNQLSIVLPVYIEGSISQKRVHKFPENTVGDER